MRNITIDFESFWDRAAKYSLSCMSTEDYVADERFEVNAVTLMVDDDPVEKFTGDMQETKEWLESWEIPKHAITGHHARLESTILAMRFGISPKFIFCTEYMHNPRFKPLMTSLSLAKLAERYGLSAKGDALYETEGLRRVEFTPAQMERHLDYGAHDTWLCRQIFKRIRGRLSNDECRILDMIIRMYSEPQLVGDADALTKALANDAARKQKIADEFEVQGITKKQLSSGEQFAQLLRDRGVDPPMKLSPSWVKKKASDPTFNEPEKWTYAFGKSDPEFLELRAELADDEELTALFDARTETKSTIEASRAKRFLAKTERHGVFRCPVVYASTHTQRLGGDESENVLNLPNVRKQKDGSFKSMLRFGLTAPKGYKVVAADYSQIEARIATCTVGQMDLLEAFRVGSDIYSEFAQDMYKRPVSKKLAEADPQAERDRKSGKETILGGDFGMGWLKFKRTVRGKGLILTDDEAKFIIGFFRSRFPCFKTQWDAYTSAIDQVLHYHEPVHVGDALFDWDPEEEEVMRIRLLNGTHLLYPGLKAARQRDSDRLKYIFRRARDKTWQNLWGGVVMNNWSQANAGILIRRAMLDIWQEFRKRAALQVYDELIYVIPVTEVDDFVKGITETMTRKWDLMPDLPLAVEVKVGGSYGHV